MKILKKFRTLLLSAYIRNKHKGRVNSDIKINFYCRFNKETVIDNGCHFNGMIIEGNGPVSIGKHCHFGKNIQIINSYHDYNSSTKIPYDDKFIDKKVLIEDYVWVGSNVIILGGVTIGEGSIIQAGSVVVHDLPKFSISGGSPAKVFKFRNEELYHNAKKVMNEN